MTPINIQHRDVLFMIADSPRAADKCVDEARTKGFTSLAALVFEPGWEGPHDAGGYRGYEGALWLVFTKPQGL